MQNVEDLRIRRTRKLLQQALIELTIEKGFAAVTVRDLTERAMVNRSTFYRHYVDKHALLRQYLEDRYRLIDSEENGPPPSYAADQLPPGLVSLLKHMQLNADFYRVMLGPNGDAAFCAESFRGYIEKGFRTRLPSETMPTDPAAPPVGLSVSYLLHAGTGAIIWWLEQGQSFTPEQVADWLLRLSTAVMGVSVGLNSQPSSRA
jgi:AcrR family transcriptional regulator